MIIYIIRYKQLCLRIDGFLHGIGYNAFALSGRTTGWTTLPRVPLRSALGYEQVALSGRSSTERAPGWGRRFGSKGFGAPGWGPQIRGILQIANK